ncbi:MAG: TIM barrel protein [Euryarchaeota archaeon]|nr:TIM barrel protein [Euryarchaeota archaeon]
MIRFGPSGIPLSCKGRTLRDAIEDVHNLGLTAMEVQLVRVNVLERPAGDEEVGRTPRALSGELVVEIRRREDKQEVRIADLGEPIDAGDMLVSLTSGLARDYEELEFLGKVAKELDIELSLHTPYYMDLAGADQFAQKSIDSILWGGLLADAMDATVVATYLGLYGEFEAKEALRRIADNVKFLRDQYRKLKLRVKLGLETSGRKEVVGGLEEILSLCKTIKGVVPVLNFAHVHARDGGLLKRPEDFASVIDQVQKFAGVRVHTHFTGVEHEGGSELRYTPIKKGDLRFEPLAECLLDADYDITLISSSPLLEHDAMYMRVILERVLAKKLVRPPRPPFRRGEAR